MLGDHAKIGHVAGALIAPLRDVTALVTDSGAAPADVQALEQAGLQVLLA
jgi:DeoR/GlpR family transcriptional regulator of sugar metabolism